MKVAVKCSSDLLQRCFEIYLKDFLVPAHLADFIISDFPIEHDKPVFTVGNYGQAILVKPFSKDQLLEALDRFYNDILRHRQPVIDWDKLEARLERVTKAYTKKVIDILRESYEKH